MPSYQLQPVSPAERLKQIQDFMTEEKEQAKLSLTLEEGIIKNMVVPPGGGDTSTPSDPSYHLAFATDADAHYEGFVLNTRDQVSLNFNRAQAGQPEQLVISQSNSVPDERKLALYRRARRCFRAYEPKAIGDLLGKDFQSAYQLHDALLSRLDAAQVRMVEQTNEHLERIGKRAADQDSEREGRFEALRAKLDQEHDDRRRTLEQQLEQERAALTARAETLSTRERELDDRNNRHARRQLQTDVKKAIATSTNDFSLSHRTNAKRHNVSLVCVTVIGLAMFGIGYTIYSPPPDVWMYATRQAFFAVTFSVTVAFFLRWENNWAQQHANEEFRLKRLLLDIDRASWIVETTLEYEAQGKSIPPTLLHDLSRNLFVEPTPIGPAKHPTESLGAALLGASSALKMKLGDTEVEVDRKGMKAFGKSAQADAED